MTSREAREILLPYRPGLDTPDGPIREALALVEQDAELREWFEQHRAFQVAMREKFQSLEVPADLRGRITAPARQRHRSVWRPGLLRLAAAIVLLLGVAGVWWWSRERTPDTFADYRARMVRNALLRYRMDVQTNDLAVVRQFLGTNGAPVNFVIPPALDRFALSGGGLLRWRGHKVSMVCYDRGDREMFFLFVIDQRAVKSAPATAPEAVRVNKLKTASWSGDGYIFLLAGLDDGRPLPALP